MPSPSDLVLDPWSGLSHKDTVAKPTSTGQAAPSWVGRSHLRRLTAYLVLWSYRKNSVRFFLRTDPNDPDRYVNHREYGDPELLVQTIRAAVVGEEPRALVDGADEDIPKEPTKADIELDGDLEEGEQLDRLAELLTEAKQEWEHDRFRIEQAMARQEWFDQWWDDEMAAQKVIETENNAVGLGDGVYELVNSTDKRRVRLRIHDPGFYFPVHESDAQGDDFPNRVHLAWEYEDDEGVRYVRRITYDRRRTGESRRYAYTDEPSEWAVFKTDATWRADQLGRNGKFGVNDFDMAKAVFAVNEDGEAIDDLDLDQDYIPVIHDPNTSAIIELWGESALTRIAQILDDLMANDTDTAVAAALIAAPPIAISGSVPAGASKTIETYGPGQVFRTGDGKMDVIDTSRSLDALLKWQDKLLERLSVNRQVPQSILGRVDLSGQLAGITLLLSFGPFRQYIGDLRLARKPKYTLFCKMVQRMSISAGWLEGEVLPANLSFGPFLPTDLDAVKNLVVALVNAKLMSRATGMRVLQEAGVDIDSIEDELDAVRRLDFTGAGELADAVADDQAARVYLGIPDAGLSQGRTGDGSQDPDSTEPPAPGSEPPVPPGPPVPLP